MRRGITVVSIIMILALLGASIFISVKLFEKNRELSFSLKLEREAATRRALSPQELFVNGDDTAFISGEAQYFDTKKQLESSGASFVDVDLKEMKLRLYDKGSLRETVDVLTKGREGSWWETPIGEYSAISKSANHYSSIGHVWMPWSIQFYGNFFIHGWPYYDDGREVEKSFSGGCIRLSTEDAKRVYEFVKRGTPILIYEDEPELSALPAITPLSSQVSPPEISSGAAIIADVDTGEVLFNKNADMELPLASITKLMSAVVGSELVYLERGIMIRNSMMRDSIQSYPLVVGKTYMAFDLYYPFLMQSSNGAGRALASFTGEGEFVRQMNEKAKTLGMTHTNFVDPNGIGEENAATLKDVAKLMKYILLKRGFIFDVTKGKQLTIFSGGELSKIQNFNDFASDPRLIGMKNGKTNVAKESMATLWALKTPDGNTRRIMIGVLVSEDRKTDVNRLLQWTEAQFGLK